jgi:Domain of unknown function (DUF1963)
MSSVGDEGQKPDWELAWGVEQQDVLGGVSFSVFAPEGLGLELCGWGEGDGDVDSVGVRHEFGEDRWIEVDSEISEDDFHLPDAQRHAAHLLEGPEVASDPRPLRVDGVDLSFAFASAGDDWVAIGSVGDVAITVRARGVNIEDVKLRALVDPGRSVDAGVPEYRPLRSDRGVFDRRRVAELAEATPIEDLGATLAGFARGGLALLVSEGVESSWIGGEPRLPADTPWPGGVHGAMTFVAQLSLADLDPSVWSGPTSGHLHVFCDIDPESNSIEGAGACAVLHTPAGLDLSVHRFPGLLHANNRVRRRMVKPRAGLTLPDADAPVMRPLGLGFDGERRADFEELCKLKRRLYAEQGWHHRAGQLLGWPTWQNDDNMAYLASLRHGEALEWTLLLQTEAVDAELYVALPTADLAAARFDRAEAIIEHD